MQDDGSKENRGWSLKGIERFNELRELVVADRTSTKSKAFDVKYLEDARKESHGQKRKRGTNNDETSGRNTLAGFDFDEVCDSEYSDVESEY